MTDSDSADATKSLGTLLRSPLPLGLLEAKMIELELHSMSIGGAPGEPPREAFLRLCEAARDAYLHDPQADILENEAARPLLQYLLNSLARYIEFTRTHPSPKTKDAYGGFARAFQVAGAAGKPSGVLEDLLIETCLEYVKAREGAIDQMGRAFPDADERALRAAYKVRYGRTFNATIQDHKSQMRELGRYLAEQGCRWGEGHLAWVEN